MADIRPSTEIELELHDYIGSAYSPTVEVTETEDGHTVSITSRKASGIVTDEFDVKDGFDPVATVARGDHKAVLTVTDKFGTTTADIPDGVSPRVEIAEDEDGHTVSITDAYGTQSYEVPDWSGDEQERVEAEERRVAAESARSTAESQRVAAETQRASAETARKSAENARSAAEGTRVQSESQRAANEAQRAAGEVQRGLNEQARVASETARETAWGTMSADVLSATDDANEAAATAMGVSVSMLGNTAHTTITGTSVHARDAISFPPVGLSVHGASVQSGTPSTASPKPISHVTSATVRVTDGWSVPVDLDGNVLRSAGGAVDDIVELSYAGVGATEGTAVYDVTLHANVGTVTLNGTEEWSLSSLGLLRTTAISDLVRLPKSTTELIPLTCTQAVATSYADLRSTTGSIAIAESGNVFVNLPSITTVGAIRSWLASHPMTVVYPLATPSETSLGRVTLQSLPAPEFTMTVDGGAVQAPFDLSYVYDVSITEQERAEEWLSLKSDAVQATSDASSAATSATTAAASASAAATNANATASSISAAAARGDYDGYSPTVAIADTELGHTVTITDRQGPHAYTVPTYADEEQARQDAWDQLSQDAQEAIDAATEAAESVSDDVDALYNGIDMLRSDIRTAEVEGGAAQVENAAKAVPIDLTVYGSSTQDGTPTPESPVAIKSVDAPEWHAAIGKNLLPNDAVDHYTVGPNGERVEDSPYTRVASAGIPCLPSTQYVLSSAQRIAFVSIGIYDASGAFIERAAINVPSGQSYTLLQFTTSANAAYLIVSAQPRSSGSISIVDVFNVLTCQLEYGSEATAYEPYSGVTAPIDLQDHELRSLPDGTKDRLDLTYDRPSSRKGWAWYKASIKAGTLKLTKDSGFSQFQQVGSTSHNSVRFAVANSMGAVSHSACNSFVYNSSTYNYGAPGDYYISSGYAYFVVPDSITSLTDANAWLAENPITLVYTNASGSTTIQLEDIELPIIPTDHATVYVTGGSAQPTWHMDYQIDADAELVQVHAELDEARAQVAQLFGNQLTSTMSGTIDTAADAFAEPPMALTVDGQSTQDGTPTPDAPVPILSVDDLALVVAGKNLFDPTLMKDQAAWNVIPIYAPVGAVLTMSTNCPHHAETGLPCYFRQPSSAQSSTNMIYASHPIVQTIASSGYVEVVQRRASGEDSFANYEWQIELGSTATAYEPYQGTTVSLYDGDLRSLPDGTKDELHLSYLRPSTRAGWAWYSREVEVWTKLVTLDDTENWRGPYNYTSGPGYYTSTKFTDIKSRTNAAVKMCNIAASGTGGNSGANTFYVDGSNQFDFIGVGDVAPTLADWEALLAETPAVVLYALSTPVTTTLDPIELPELPAPTCTVFCDGGSAQPTFVMQYVQDTNLVIADLRAALADLATS